MPANTKPISSRNAAQEAFENEKLAAQSMTVARAAAQIHPVTKGVTEPLMRITEGLKKKGMKSGGITKMARGGSLDMAGTHTWNNPGSGKKNPKGLKSGGITNKGKRC